MRKILVLRGGALGDFLVTLPALALLRQRWPKADIDLVGNATAAALGVQAGLLTRAESQHDRIWSALYDPAPLPAELHARLAAYDLVVNYWPDPDGTLAQHFPNNPGQIFLSASAQPQLAPAAAHYCAPLTALGLTAPNLAYIFARWAARSARGGLSSAVGAQLDCARLDIALHPGSGSPGKNWPVDRWAALADWLNVHHQAQVFVVSGEAEPDGILAGRGTPWCNLPLNELATRLARCRLFIGHDSGISHLAAAVGTPSLLLFGPTEPAMWAPPHPQVQVLHRGPELAAITLAEVQQTTATLLANQ